MSAKHWLTEDERLYIKENYQKMTIKEIGINLGRNSVNIYNYLTKKLGVSAYKIKSLNEPVIMVEKKEPIKRPPTVYTNSKSPYGIADELMLELAYLNPQMSKRIIL
jgi:hypothetical protein